MGVANMKAYKNLPLSILLTVTIVLAGCTRSGNGETVGPIEIPRAELSTKYGWDGKTYVVPTDENHTLPLSPDWSPDVKHPLTLAHDNNPFIVAPIGQQITKEGMEIERFTKVGDGWYFEGGNFQIGNLIFAGHFKWSDEKITLKAGAKMSLAPNIVSLSPAQSNKIVEVLGQHGTGDIFEATRSGDMERVQYLLKDDPSLVFKTETDGGTALHWAAANGYKNIAEC